MFLYNFNFQTRSVNMATVGVAILLNALIDAAQISITSEIPTICKKLY